MSRDVLESPGLLFELLDDASLRWFLCHPTPCVSGSAAADSWTQTEWLSNFGMFTVGAYIANKLEQLIWKGYVSTLPSPVASLPADGACACMCFCCL